MGRSGDEAYVPLRVELTAISNGYTLDESLIKGPESLEEKPEKKRRLKEFRLMETINNKRTAQKVQETNVSGRQSETRKVEAECKNAQL